MELILLLLAFILSAIFLLKTISSTSHKTKALPGPWTNNIPIVAHWPFLHHPRQEEPNRLAEKYGPIYRLRVGGQNYVILSTEKVLLETLKRKANCFGKRPLLPVGPYVTGMTHSGLKEEWLNLKKDILLPSQKLASVSFVEITSQEVDALVSDARKMVGVQFDPQELLATFIVKLVYRLSYGLEARNENIEDVKSVTLTLPLHTWYACGLSDFNLFFWLRNIRKGLFSRFIAAQDFITNINRKHIAQRLLMVAPSIDNPPEEWDMLSAHMAFLKKSQFDINDFKVYTGIEDFFRAGSEAPGICLNFLIYYLASYPEEQERCWEEIKSNISESEHRITYDDRNRLCYVDAVIHEVFRHACPIPIIKRQVTTAFECEGYTLPLGTEILANLKSVHDDPSIFPEPREFKPERFIGVDGTFRKDLASRMVTFGYGSQRCKGQELSMEMMFMPCVALLRRFRIALVEPSNAVIEGITLSLETYKICLHERQA